MKTNLTFDKNGFITPYEAIETDLETIKKNFVDAFPNSGTRRIIFENYTRFLYNFQDQIYPHFEQWIDGSFTKRIFKVNFH